MPTHRILDGALSLAMEYGHFDIACRIVDALAPWNFHAMLAAIQRILFIYWESHRWDLLRLTLMAMLGTIRRVLALSSMIQTIGYWLQQGLII